MGSSWGIRSLGLGGAWRGLVVWIAAAAVAGGQTLAHRNWEGSGLTVQAWWSRGVFCAAGSDLKRVAGEMDALERLGCDAVEVTPGSGYGATEAMDAVTEAAGQRKMRVVVDLDREMGEQALRERVAFWGARGAAGFAVRGAAEMVVGRLRQVAGGRLLIGDGGQLVVRQSPEGSAAEVRVGLADARRQGVLLEDGEARLGSARAAMLLLSGGAARIAVDAVLPRVARVEMREFSAEELLLWVPEAGKEDRSAEDWVRALGELRRGNERLRMGKASFLDLDAVGLLGWVVTGRDGRGGVLVVCNLTGKAVRAAVADALRGAGMKGTSLKALLRSDGAVGGGDSLEGIGLGPDGVFVGELR